MLERTYPGQICSIARSLEVVGERWTLLILRDAQLGLKRFEEGLLERRPYRSGHDRFEYVLTDEGRELGPALIMLMKWGDRYYPERSGPPRLTIHHGCGGRVDRRMRCGRCRRHVDFGELDVRPGPGLRATRSQGTPAPRQPTRGPGHTGATAPEASAQPSNGQPTRSPPAPAAPRRPQ